MPSLLQKFRKGEYITEYKTDNGRTVRFRGPRKSDVNDILKLINGLVEEDAMILVDKKKTRKEENTYVTRVIKENKEGSALHLVAEVDGKVVAKAEVHRKKDKSNHVGTLGISVSKGYRDIGIGKTIMRLLSELSKELGLRLIILEAYAENSRAIHVYQKSGFKIVGRIPKDIHYRNKYVDSVIMVKEL